MMLTLTEVIKIWDEMRVEETDHIGFCDLERAIETVVGPICDDIWGDESPLRPERLGEERKPGDRSAESKDGRPEFSCRVCGGGKRERLGFIDTSDDGDIDPQGTAVEMWACSKCSAVFCDPDRFSAVPKSDPETEVQHADVDRQGV